MDLCAKSYVHFTGQYTAYALNCAPNCLVRGNALVVVPLPLLRVQVRGWAFIFVEEHPKSRSKSPTSSPTPQTRKLPLERKALKNPTSSKVPPSSKVSSNDDSKLISILQHLINMGKPFKSLDIRLAHQF